VCGVRCGCRRDLCRLRGTGGRDPGLSVTQINQEDKENLDVRPATVSNVTNLLKSKRLVTIQPTTPYKEEPDLEMSSLGTKLKGCKGKIAEKTADLTIDVSFLETQKKNRLSVFNSPMYEKFRTNHRI